MTNKMKCPFCGEELKQTSLYMDGNHRFTHKYVGALEGGKDRCPLDGETLHYRGWQALMQQPCNNVLEMLEHAAKERRKELEQSQKNLETAMKAIECAERFLLGVQDRKIEIGKSTRSSHLLLFQLPAMAALCLNTIRDYKNQIETATKQEEN